MNGEKSFVVAIALAASCLAACGGSAADAGGGADASAGAGGDASADASAGADAGGSGDAGAGSSDGGVATSDAAPSCGTLSDFCATRGLCNAEGAAANCGQGVIEYDPVVCGDFIVVTYGHTGPPDSPTTILYYDKITGQLVEVDEYSGGNPGHLVCATGGRAVPAPSSCHLAACPNPTRDAGACPSGVPTSGAPCTTEGVVCPVVGGCTPTCECFAGGWRCGSAPPCPPPPP